MAKNKLAKAIHSGPVMPKVRRAEITQCKNGYVVEGAYDNKTGCSPKFIAKTEKEAKDIASTLL